MIKTKINGDLKVFSFFIYLFFIFYFFKDTKAQLKTIEFR